MTLDNLQTITAKEAHALHVGKKSFRFGGGSLSDISILERVHGGVKSQTKQVYQFHFVPSNLGNGKRVYFTDPSNNLCTKLYAYKGRFYSRYELRKLKGKGCMYSKQKDSKRARKVFSAHYHENRMVELSNCRTVYYKGHLTLRMQWAHYHSFLAEKYDRLSFLNF